MPLLFYSDAHEYLIASLENQSIGLSSVNRGQNLERVRSDEHSLSRIAIKQDLIVTTSLNKDTARNNPDKSGTQVRVVIAQQVRSSRKGRKCRLKERD